MDETLEKIKNFAKTILHCGDYGQTFFNPNTGVVHWVGGDSDGLFDEITDGFMKIPGVTSVIIADEYFPDNDENNYGDWILVFNPNDEGDEYWSNLMLRLDILDRYNEDIDVNDIDISNLFK
jgi:hypothetical protein